MSKPASLERITDHDRSFIRRAIEEKSERVEKIAKANDDAGYHKEATVLRGDARYARDELVPAFEAQLQAFQKTEAEAKAGIANILFDFIRGDVALKAKPAETCDKLAERVLAFAKQVYDRAYSAGVADRQQYGVGPVLIASLPGLRHGPQKAEDDEG